QYRRRERPKALAIFHLQIEVTLHGWRAGVAQDRARAERAWTELHATLEPADRLLISKRGDRFRDHFVFAQHREPRARSKESLFDLCLGKAWPQERAEHAVAAVGLARLVLKNVRRGERRTERTAGVARRANRPAGGARRRLNPDVFECTIGQPPAIGDAIERYGAREAQIL